MNFHKSESPNKKTPNTLKSEHLNEGVKPVIGGIYDRIEMTDKDRDFFKDFKNNAEFIDFKIKPEQAIKNKLYNKGMKTYVISQINKENKYSKEYFDCTAVYATGIDIDTGENISFLSHQNPEQFLKNNNISVSLKEDLNKSLNELIRRSKPGSIDAVVLGGNKDNQNSNSISDADMNKMNPQQIMDYMDQQNTNPFDKYRKSINYLSKIIFEKLNFYPTVISGPNSNIKVNDFTHDNALDLYCDTKDRRVYQIRPENESINNESFSGEEINKKINDYK
jgi:hypothetical protein